MAPRGPEVQEGIRFAAGVCADPSGVVALWKSVTGGKTAGCVPASPVPELLLAADLLPIAVESPGDLSPLSGRIDAWLIGPEPVPFSVPGANTPRFALSSSKPASIEEALDRLESLAEWACDVSGSPASEGALWKSIRTHAARRSLLDALEERCAREPSFLTAEERRDILRAGNFLPPEAHARILSSILGVDPVPAGGTVEGEKGDPLIVLARRIAAG